MKLTAKQKLFAKRAGWVAFGTSVLVVAREIYLATTTWPREWREAYERAVAQRDELQRQNPKAAVVLITVGDPEAKFLQKALGRMWQCGNLCIAPQGCSTCGGPGQTTIAGDPETVLRNQILPMVAPGAKFVVFDTYMPYASDPVAYAKLLKKVAPGAVHMIDVSRFSLNSWFGAGRKRVMTALPPESAQVEWKPLWWEGGAAGTAQLKGLVMVDVNDNATPAILRTSYFAERGRPLGLLVTEVYTRKG